MNLQIVTITYEDESVVELKVPDCLLLANAQWVDWLVAIHAPDANDETDIEVIA